MPSPDDVVKAALANAKVAEAVKVPVTEAIKKNAALVTAPPSPKVEQEWETSDGKPPRFVGGSLEPVNAKKKDSDKPVKPGAL